MCGSNSGQISDYGSYNWSCAQGLCPSSVVISYIHLYSIANDYYSGLDTPPVPTMFLDVQE